MGKPWTFHTCKLCSYRSQSTFIMYKHGRLHRTRLKNEDAFMCNSKAPEMLECQLCGFDTDIKVDLKQHLCIVHEGKEVNDMKNILKGYHCQSCDFVTHSVLLLMRHNYYSCNNVFDNYLQQKVKISFMLRTTDNYFSCNDISDVLYEEIVCTNESKETLEKIADNLHMGLPRVVIPRIRLTPKLLQAQHFNTFVPNNSVETQPIASVQPTTSTDNKNTKLKTKKNFCIYCKELRAHLPRHLEMRHRTEEQVKKILYLPKGSPKRKQILDKIRKVGNFEFNTSKNSSQKDLLVCRRLKSPNKDYKCCWNCLGFFSKNSLRKHVINCVKRKRSIHPKAPAVLPLLRNDEISAIMLSRIRLSNL